MAGEPPIGGVIRWEFPALSPDKRGEMIEVVMRKIKMGAIKSLSAYGIIWFAL